MDVDFLNTVSPYVRRAHIMESKTLLGEWADYDYCCTLIQSGRAVFRVGEERFELQTGDIILIPPMLPHMILSDDSAPLYQYIMHFDFFYDADRATYRTQHITVADFPEKRPIPQQEMVLERPMVLHLDDSNLFEYTSLFLQMFNAYQGDDPLRDITLKQLCLRLLILIFRQSGEAQAPFLGTDRHIHPLVAQAMDFIRVHYDNPDLSNEQIAAEVHLSPKHLSHLFRREIHMPIHRYLNGIRILAAQKLARFTSMNLSQIATAVGFNSQQTFCKVLQRTVHATPTEFLFHTCADNSEVYLKLAIGKDSNLKQA